MVYPEINYQSGVPLYQQLKRSFQRMAALGLMDPDQQLPSVRQMAAELGINPNTVQKAYREMEQEGLIYAVPGRGNFLSGQKQDQTLEKEEIRRSFRHDAQVAWVAGLAPETLHQILDSCLEEQRESSE